MYMTTKGAPDTMTKATTKIDPTQSERTSRYRAKGRFIGVLIRDGEAIKALEALELEQGSLAGAVNAALLHYQATKLDPAFTEAAKILRNHKETSNEQQAKPKPRRRSP